MVRLKNKKGAEMTIGTIIIIILALLVLVLLVMGFTTGWANLWDKLKNLGPGGQSNVDTIVQACGIACTSNSQFEYCKPREVNFGKEDPRGKQTLNCKNIEDMNLGLEQCDTVSCNKLSCKNSTIDASCTGLTEDICKTTANCTWAA